MRSKATSSTEIRRLTAELVKVSESADSREAWLKEQLEAALAAIKKPQAEKKPAAPRKRSTTKKAASQKPTAAEDQQKDGE